MNIKKNIKHSNSVKQAQYEFFILENQEIPYNLIFINDKGNASMIETNIKFSNKNQEFEIKELKEKEDNLNKKNFDNYIKLIDGIIFTYFTKQNEIINNTLDYIFRIYKKIQKEKTIPIIIFGEKTDIINSLVLKKDKRVNKINDFLFLPKLDTYSGFDFPIREFLKTKNIFIQYDKFIMKNKINEINFINNMNKYKINLLKCSQCNKVFQITFNQFSNTILLSCQNCNIEKKVDEIEFLALKNNIKCHECNKWINSVINQNNYCFMCKKNICNECEKNHLKKEEKSNIIKLGDILYQNNLVDAICNIHYKFCYSFCLTCNRNICPYCQAESHMEHITKIYDTNIIKELVSEEKGNIEIEKAKYKSIKMLINECINDLKNYFDNLVVYKEKEIEIKEQMIKECEIYKYDEILIENIKKFNLNNDKKWINREQETWDKKLNRIFEFFNEPIKITKTKLCIEENLKGPYDILKQVKLNDTIGNKDYITDICPLFDYKGKNHFAVSLGNGILKIYNDDFDSRIPINIIKEFDEDEGINSLYKCSRKSIILVGNTKIKKIFFSEDLEKYKVINEIESKNQVFMKAIDLNCFDILMATNSLNQILCFNFKKGNLLSDITSIVNSAEMDYEALFMDKISDNKIIFLFKESCLMRASFGRGTIRDTIFEIDFSQNGSVNKLNNEIYYREDFNKTFWKIIELDLDKNNNVEINKSQSFQKEINYLGEINEQFILLFNTINSKIIIFDVTSFSNNLELSFFNYIEKPILNLPLNKRKDFLDIVFLCEEGYLIQYVLNLKLELIYPIAKIKINDEIIENNHLIDSNGEEPETKEKPNKNNICKIINLEKTNFLIISNNFNIFNLKHRK